MNAANAIFHCHLYYHKHLKYSMLILQQLLYYPNNNWHIVSVVASPNKTWLYLVSICVHDKFGLYFTNVLLVVRLCPCVCTRVNVCAHTCECVRMLDKNDLGTEPKSRLKIVQCVKESVECLHVIISLC